MLGAVTMDTSEYTLVDYGCGKGRAVLLAAECGFGRIIGIELATALAETARANAKAYAMRRPDSGPIDIRCMDAADFMPPQGKLFCFFYNPFGPAVLRKVVDLIELTHRHWRTPLIIGYRNPVHSYVFEEADFLECVARNRSFAIYKSSAICGNA